jgi:cytochrome c
VIFATYAGSGVASTQQDAAAKSVWDGVYTTAQADRGKKLFGQSCAPCHMENLQGDSADIPALVGDDFLNAWTDQSVDALFRRIQSTMPQDSPSSLSTQVYVDILTYILQSNKFPEGQVELKRDETLMKGIMIKKTK